MARTVTTTDRTIIRLLQADPRASYAELSRITRIPESTVRRRMERLQQRGIIEFAMVADPAKLGYDIRAMIGLRVELVRLDEIANELRHLDEVTFAAFLTGNFDVMLQVVVQSQEALVELLTKKIPRIEGVRSTETFVMPWIIKSATSWLLPEHREPRPTPENDDDDDEIAANEPEPSKPRRGRPRKVTSSP